MILSVQCIVVLYVWELIYRSTIGIPLLVHHLVTILLLQLVTASFFDTKNVVYLRFALVLGFYATMEQTSYVALLLYRLDLFQKKQQLALHFATTQTFIFKTSIMIWSIVYYSRCLRRGHFQGTSGARFRKFPFFLLPLLTYTHASLFPASTTPHRFGCKPRRIKGCQIHTSTFSSQC